MNTKDQIKVMQAYVDGKTIQRHIGSYIWVDDKNPKWCWDVLLYRVKPDTENNNTETIEERKNKLIEKVYDFPYDKATNGNIMKMISAKSMADMFEFVLNVQQDTDIEKAIEWIEYHNENGGCNFDNWQHKFRKNMKG